MDLGSVKKKDLNVVTLYLPNGTKLVNDDSTDMTITVCGLYSDTYRNASEEQQNDRIKRVQKSGGKLSLTSSEIRANRMELVAKCVESWDITLDGAHPPVMNKTNVMDLFQRCPFVYDQLSATLEDAEAFLEL